MQDWNAPFVDSRKRRSTSKLESLPSQKPKEEEDEGDESEVESARDEDEAGSLRKRRKSKFTQSISADTAKDFPLILCRLTHF